MRFATLGAAPNRKHAGRAKKVDTAAEVVDKRFSIWYVTRGSVFSGHQVRGQNPGGTVMTSFAQSSRVRPAVLAAFVAISLLCAPKAAAQEALTEEQRIVHILNRLAYGPRPGDIDRLRALGIQAYVEQQLHPEQIPDPVVDEKLADFTALNLTIPEGVEAFQPLAPRANRRRESAQTKAERADQAKEADLSPGRAIHPSSSDPVRRRLLNPRASGMAPGIIKPREMEIYEAKLIRTVHSERQLLEVMVDFWMNHFSVDADFGDHYLIADYEQRVIRPHALGKFEDLVLGTAQHPAMLIYLNNWLSAAPEEVLKERLDAWQPESGENKALALRRRQPFFDQAKGLNENYARELMELHTIGVEGGYEQQDVLEVAKALTGWTLSATREDGTDGTFVFDPLLHVAGDKVVMGQAIESGGMEEGAQIIEMLAHHPSAARFISTKLVRRFVADNPPPELVEIASLTFERTGGDIREVLRAIFASPDFFAPEYYGIKVKKPLEVVASAVRAVNGEIDFQSRDDNIIVNPQARFQRYLSQYLTHMGEALYQREDPDGYPDVASAWISTNTLFKRLDFAIALASGQVPGVEGVQLEAAKSLLQRMGIPEPTPAQIAQGRSLVAKAEQAAQRSMMLDEAMMDEAMQDEAMQDEAMMDAGMMQERRQDERAAGDASEAHVIAAAIMLGSPQFQRR